MDKLLLRKILKEQRNRLSENDCIAKSNIICNKIIESSYYKNANILFCYCAINNEVNLMPIINKALSDKKTVALPKVYGKNILFHKIENVNDLQLGKFNILEPNENNEIINNADIVIVPGLGFSKEGDRIGYGAGYYDKYLLEHPLFTMGVCYDFQLVNEIKSEKHDIKMDLIITDK